MNKHQNFIWSFLDMGFLCLPTNVTIYANISSALSEMTGFTKILLEIRNNWALESIMLGFAYLLG